MPPARCLLVKYGINASRMCTPGSLTVACMLGSLLPPPCLGEHLQRCTSKLLAPGLADLGSSSGSHSTQYANTAVCLCGLLANQLSLQWEWQMMRHTDHRCRCSQLASGGEMALKVTVSKVSSLDGSRHHTEVAGCSPDLNEQLAACLAAGEKLPDGRKARLEEMISRLAQFARDVRG
jgi:hypothetical protein